MVDIYVGTENTHWILHEKLLCTKSKFFAKVFWDSSNNKFSKHRSPNPTSGNKSFGLPDEDNRPFNLFVGWLYSAHIPFPEEEQDLGDLFDLYLMGEKWSISNLVKDVLEAVRRWYRASDTYPGLRRVQYIYANTDSTSPMRQLLVGSIARMLMLGDGMPSHWDKALRKNGQLAVDIILNIQHWKFNPDDVPDARQEMLKPEEDKVKVVEKMEREQGGLPRSPGQSIKSYDEEEQTTPSKASKNKESPKQTPNGIHGDEEDFEAVSAEMDEDGDAK